MQIAVILHDVASQLFLLCSASVRIESLLLLDVIACEDDYIPSSDNRYRYASPNSSGRAMAVDTCLVHAL